MLRQPDDILARLLGFISVIAATAIALQVLGYPIAWNSAMLLAAVPGLFLISPSLQKHAGHRVRRITTDSR